MTLTNIPLLCLVRLELWVKQVSSCGSRTVVGGGGCPSLAASAPSCLAHTLHGSRQPQGAGERRVRG